MTGAVCAWRWRVVFVLVNLVLVRSWARRTSRVARSGLAQAGFGWAVAWGLFVARACDCLTGRDRDWVQALIKDRPAGDCDRVQERCVSAE